MGFQQRKLISLLKEAYKPVFSIKSFPGVNAWATENSFAESLCHLHAHDFVFLRFRQLVDLSDMSVSEFLNLLEPIAFRIFRDRFVLQHFLQLIIFIAPNIANSSAMLFGDLVNLF